MSMTMSMPAAAPAAPVRSQQGKTASGTTGGDFDAALTTQLDPSTRDSAANARPKQEVGGSSGKETSGSTPSEEGAVTALSMFSFLVPQEPALAAGTGLADDTAGVGGDALLGESAGEAAAEANAADALQVELAATPQAAAETEAAQAASLTQAEVGDGKPDATQQDSQGMQAEDVLGLALQRAGLANSAQDAASTNFGGQLEASGQKTGEPLANFQRNDSNPSGEGTPESAAKAAGVTAGLVPAQPVAGDEIAAPQAQPQHAAAQPIAAKPEATADTSLAVAATATQPAVNATADTTATARATQPQPANTPAGMLEQMRGPLGRLVQAPQGQHTFTVNVTPENLGPVTVRAHITAESIRVELIGATDAARDSLRHIMTDLRRDLQSTGLNAQLNLSSDTGAHAQTFAESGDQGRRELAQTSAATGAASDSTFIDEPTPVPTRDHVHGDQSVDILA